MSTTKTPSPRARALAGALLRDPDALQARIVAERARRSGSRSFAAFVKQAWPIFEPAALRWGWHLDAVCEHLEAVARGQIRRLVINAPPRHGKSNLFAILWPAWVWTFRPVTQFMFISYATKLSAEHSVKCRQVIESPWYRETHARSWHISEDQNTKTDFVNSMRGRRRATSVEAGITGHGGDIIGIDDPLNAAEANSDAAMRKAWSVVSEAVNTRLNNADGAVVLFMQRLATKDPAQLLLNTGQYEHLMIPMEYEPRRRCFTFLQYPEKKPLWEDPRTVEGELIDGARFGRDTLEAMKVSLGPIRYAGQYQQRPAPAEGGLFRIADWRFWQPDDETAQRFGYARTAARPEGCATVEHAPPKPLNLDDVDELVISVDGAGGKETDDGSLTAIHVWAKKGARRCLVYRVSRRMDFSDTVAELLRVIGLFPYARRKFIEAKAAGSSIINTLERQHGISGIEPVNPGKASKLDRAHAGLPYHRAHNVEIPEGAPWVEDHIAEHAAFPNGENDDNVDAQSQALLGMEQEESTMDLWARAGV